MSRRSKAKDASSPTIRCAIYTRKSSDEGLDQEFNSLDAQRESAEAFIASQKAEGWEVNADRYDDGGFSGGTMERPALDRLLRDIEAGKIDCVVVYKVDRLSRSLMDFSRIMETFEKAGVSFVSVTQQFNTTHSMGRLTLNILLSFARFKRDGYRLKAPFYDLSGTVTIGATDAGRFSVAVGSPHLEKIDLGCFEERLFREPHVAREDDAGSIRRPAGLALIRRIARDPPQPGTVRVHDIDAPVRREGWIGVGDARDERLAGALSLRPSRHRRTDQGEDRQDDRSHGVSFEPSFTASRARTVERRLDRLNRSYRTQHTTGIPM